ncbi:hypothetical protein [Actinosynnema sp. NPDC023587]|uniref:hypothetical protein n=1 Tax=Actinosynnema sp. NPDC023587 TaxID=3154695 RepID=UPI0033FF497F
MTNRPPRVLDGAQVELVALRGQDQVATGATRHSVAGFPQLVVGLAIARYEDDSSAYLFYCNSEWEVMSDTYHDSIDAAVAQARWEFENLSFSPLED